MIDALKLVMTSKVDNDWIACMDINNDDVKLYKSQRLTNGEDGQRYRFAAGSDLMEGAGE